MFKTHGFFQQQGGAAPSPPDQAAIGYLRTVAEKDETLPEVARLRTIEEKENG